MFCCCPLQVAVLVDDDDDETTLLVSLSYDDTEEALENEPKVVELRRLSLNTTPVRWWFAGPSRGSTCVAMLLADVNGSNDLARTMLAESRLVSTGLAVGDRGAVGWSLGCIVCVGSN
jgi:hypothetical protein